MCVRNVRPAPYPRDIGQYIDACVKAGTRVTKITTPRTRVASAGSATRVRLQTPSRVCSPRRHRSAVRTRTCSARSRISQRPAVRLLTTAALCRAQRSPLVPATDRPLLGVRHPHAARPHRSTHHCARRGVRRTRLPRLPRRHAEQSRCRMVHDRRQARQSYARGTRELAGGCAGGATGGGYARLCYLTRLLVRYVAVWGGWECSVRHLILYLYWTCCSSKGAANPSIPSGLNICASRTSVVLGSRRLSLFSWVEQVNLVYSLASIPSAGLARHVG